MFLLSLTNKLQVKYILYNGKDLTEGQFTGKVRMVFIPKWKNLLWKKIDWVETLLMHAGGEDCNSDYLFYIYIYLSLSSIQSNIQEWGMTRS